jgi:hypothetical protein
MTSRLAAFCLIAVFGLPAASLRADVGSIDSELSRGIGQVQAGEFDQALITLDGVVKVLSAQGGSKARDLGRAYAYLAIAYAGLAQEEKAKAEFLEALKVDRNMRMSPSEFPPNVIAMFEEARKEAAQKEGRKYSPATPAPAPGAMVEKHGGGNGALIALGAAAAVGGGVALAAGGKSQSTPAPTPTPTPASVLGTWAGGFNYTAGDNCGGLEQDTVTFTSPTGALSGNIVATKTCNGVPNSFSGPVAGTFAPPNISWYSFPDKGCRNIGTVVGNTMTGTVANCGELVGTWILTRTN